MTGGGSLHAHAIPAKRSPGRLRPEETHYYCGGRGCSRGHRFATYTLYKDPENPSAYIGDLRSGDNFRIVGGAWQLFQTSIRDRGRQEAFRRRHVTAILERTPMLADQYPALPELLRRADRPLKHRQLGPGVHLFRCPDCGAVNELTAPQSYPVTPEKPGFPCPPGHCLPQPARSASPRPAGRIRLCKHLQAVPTAEAPLQ